MLVQITTSTFGKAGSKPIEYLKSKNISFRLNPYGRKLTEDEAGEVLSDVDAVIAGTEPLTEKVLKQLPNLKVISRCGTGMNNVDLKAAKRLGIKVVNTPTIHVDAVAELTLAGTLAVLRNFAKNDQTVRSGEWNKDMGRSLYDKTVGIIGFGKVGRRFSELLKPFTSNIIYYDPYLTAETRNATIAEPLSLNDLFKRSDIISIHVPYTEENHYLVNAENLNLAKKDVTIVNTSRGGLINEDDLFTFLDKHPASAAYLDVFEIEPYNGPLRKLSNVILSPHVGTTTKETREAMELEASVNLLKELGYE